MTDYISWAQEKTNKPVTPFVVKIARVVEGTFDGIAQRSTKDKTSKGLPLIKLYQFEYPSES